MTESRRSSKRRSKAAAQAQSPLADIIGKVVRIPATMYGIDVPGMMYRAKVLKKDTSHKNAVVLSFFEDDGSQHWAPAEDVRKWLSLPDEEGRCTGEESDKYAIETLLQFRKISRRGSCESPVADCSLDLASNPQSTSTKEDSPYEAGNEGMEIDTIDLCMEQFRNLGRQVDSKYRGGLIPCGDEVSQIRKGKWRLEDLVGAIGGLEESIDKDLMVNADDS